MIGVDTNILVRLLTRDDPVQHAAAVRFMTARSPQDPAYVCREVLIELVWVLGQTYRYRRDEIAEALRGLLIAPDIVFEADADVKAALVAYRETAKLDFADAMIAAAARRAGASELVTFDKRAAALPGVRLLPA
ncbi:MAG: type II toxin-antitoxin system VapC family toxin [Oceanicaulis sp.]